MDSDIRPPKEEASEEPQEQYDPEFIKFDEEEIEGIKRFGMTNFVAINRRRRISLIIRDALLDRNATANSILLDISTSLLFKKVKQNGTIEYENSDGMITEESARAIERLGVPVKHVTLMANHDIGSSRRTVRAVLKTMRYMERKKEAEISR